MLRLIVFGIIFSYYINTNAQVLSGFVYNQKNNPLEGVSIYFLNTNMGQPLKKMALLYYIEL